MPTPNSQFPTPKRAADFAGRSHAGLPVPVVGGRGWALELRASSRFQARPGGCYTPEFGRPAVT